MDLELPDTLALSLQGLIDPDTALGQALAAGAAARGTRVVSSHHFDGGSLNLLYQLSQAAQARDVVFQLLALDNMAEEAPLQAGTALERLVPAVVQWLARDRIDGWLYQRGKDGALLAWLVHSVRHVQPSDGQAYVVVGLLANTLSAAGREPPSDPRLRFAGMTWGLSFYAEDLAGRSVAGLFADQGFFKECPEFRREYDAQMARFGRWQARHGAQFLASGVAWRMQGPAARPTGEPLRLPEGVSARCVNDEALLNRRFDTHADPHWWRGQGVASGFERIPQHAYLHLFHLDWHLGVWVHVQHLEEYRYQPQLREHLVLPQAQRDLIDILTAERHFLMRDFVAGKSGGTTILCMGAPGLGKTLTAEVYAEVVGKPLYRVHAGQLGVTAESVQSQLAHILQRAARWDCVLLLDEADVYIRRRDNDLQHNAIVAEFLRSLEYFSGLLFMTTNRVDDIDDAILSRCIAVVRYEAPSPQDARRLWLGLAAQLGLDLADDVVDALLRQYPGLSGRDIKELLILSSKYCRGKSLPLDTHAIAHCAVFRGLRPRSLEESPS